MTVKAERGDIFTEAPGSFETCGIDLTINGAEHHHQIEVYGNPQLRDVLVELINQNAEIIELALKS